MTVCRFEKVPSQTGFYDFKPFLYGRTAAAHYSIRQDAQKALWRQPKVGDVLDLIQEKWVLETIKHYPLDQKLRASETDFKTTTTHTVYDLAFFLPLFGHLLAPENQVPTYKFSRGGGLSLTVVGRCCLTCRFGVPNNILVVLN